LPADFAARPDVVVLEIGLAFDAGEERLRAAIDDVVRGAAGDAPGRAGERPSPARDLSPGARSEARR
jgi:hypothetical protein